MCFFTQKKPKDDQPVKVARMYQYPEGSVEHERMQSLLRLAEEEGMEDLKDSIENGPLWARESAAKDLGISVEEFTRLSKEEDGDS